MIYLHSHLYVLVDEKHTEFECVAHGGLIGVGMNLNLRASAMIIFNISKLMFGIT